MGVSRTASTFAPPVMAARRWLAGKSFDADIPLINVSQAAPVEPPPAPLISAMAEMLSDSECHLYGPVLGLDALRDEVAKQWSLDYGGSVNAAQVAITSGCNQAFAAAIASIAGEGDEVILPTPFYFNHKMWLDMQGVKTVPLPVGPDMLPGITEVAALINARTRAIALVTPNNPCGVEYPSELLDAFFELCAEHDIKLIIDETYRDFHSSEDRPHGLFAQDRWDQTLIQLYSFSKTYRLTGHRVGAMVTSPDQLAEAEKFLDTIAICPNQLGQRAALWGMQNLGAWRAGERLEILGRRAAVEEYATALRSQGWRLLGVGAYFAYFEHPFEMPSDKLAERLVSDAAILCLPGTMFVPEGDATGAKHLRIAFANIDRAGIATLIDRFNALPYPRRERLPLS
ncbi:MAG: aminotransferase [Pseudomonadota bacterium]